jgi:PAS domain S-box-containing protein
MNLNLLETIFENLPIVVFVKDDQHRYVYVNDVFTLHAGLPREKCIGFTDREFQSASTTEELGQSFIDSDDAVLKNGDVVETVFTYSVAGTTPTPFLTRKVRLMASDGRAYILGTSMDIGIIKKQEAELAQKEARYRALAESAPVGIWHVDEGGKTVFCNRQLVELFAMDESGIQNLNANTVLKASVGFEVSRMVEHGSRSDMNLVLPHGMQGRVILAASPWLLSDEQRTTILSFADISKVSDLETINEQVVTLNKELAAKMKELRSAQDEVIRKGKMAQLGQLTATVAHEIRNPLGAIRTSAFLLERKLRGKELGIESQLERINNGVVRCDDIITQLLDFARSKKLELLPTAIDAWLTELVEQEAQNLPARLNIILELGLGELAVGLDKTRLSRAVINLLSNASEAMVGKGKENLTQGALEPQIKILTKLTARGVEVMVEDNGPGMTAEILARIREPLFTTKSFGTGLGIPAIEQIIEQHHGGLDIWSEPGRGAKFTLWWPVQRPELAVA